jgi:hypothetical protein
MLLLIAVGPVPAVAGDWEIAPFVGFVTGGSVDNLTTGASSGFDSGASLGLMADFRLGEESWLEIIWSRQKTEACTECLWDRQEPFEVDIDYLHVGGMYQPAREKVRPFVLASVGFTRFAPSPGGFKNQIFLSGAVGGGAKFFFGPRIGLRLDARLWGTFGSGSFGGFCGEGGCAIGFSEGGTLQFQGVAALVVAFPGKKGTPRSKMEAIRSEP